MFRFVVILAVSVGALLPMGEGVKAEGRCPPGQFPVGGEGMLGCAPIPQAAAEPAAPRPTGRWIETWGAFAVSGTTGGAATGLRSKAEASRAAIADCAKDGARNCEVKMTYKNQCMAAMYFGPGYESRLRSAATADIASQGLERDCRAQVPNGVCEIIYTGCSEPIFEKY